MKLQLTKRAPGKRSEVNALRRQGNIPAVLYGNGNETETAALKGPEWAALMRALPAGRLSTTVFEINFDGKTHRALVKDIQYHVVSYAVEHIDFHLISDKHPVDVQVPIEVVGSQDSPGVKLGGKFRQTLRSVRVRCKSGRHIPGAFSVRADDLNIGQSKRIQDVAFPEDVKPLDKLEEVVAVVAKV